MVHKECYYDMKRLTNAVRENIQTIEQLTTKIAKLEKTVDILHDKLRREQFETQYTGQEVYRE